MAAGSVSRGVWFPDGVRVFSQAGALSSHALEELTGQVRALDIDALRTELVQRALSAEDEIHPHPNRRRSMSRTVR